MSDYFVAVPKETILGLVGIMSHQEFQTFSVIMLNANEEGLTDIDNYKLAYYCGIRRETFSRRLTSLSKRELNGEPVITIMNFRPTVIKISEKLGIDFTNGQGTYDSEKYEDYLNRNSRAIVGYGQWKKTVKKRDKYQCKKCNSKENLVVHHIEGFAKNKELRLDLMNGVTLCDNCHIQYHQKYGYHNSNESDFKKFMEEDITQWESQKFILEQGKREQDSR